MEYKASLDNLAKIITLAVLILFIYVSQESAQSLIDLEEYSAKNILSHSWVILLCVAIFLGSYLFSSNKYTIQNGQLLIKRPIGSVTINLNDIVEVKKINESDMSWTIRTFGIGGLFGYHGKFYNSKMGHMTFYVTQRGNRILIKTNAGKKIILSPDDISMAEKLSELSGK